MVHFMGNNSIVSKSLEKDIARFYEEDDLVRNQFYFKTLSTDEVDCSLFLKSEMVLAGLPYFFECFKYLGANNLGELSDYSLEGSFFSKSETEEPKPCIQFKLPFSIALTGERIALNLLQRASSVATSTKKLVDKCKHTNIKILDTRKTTPGLRGLEKYAVRVGGGYNHRFGQTDVWMVKDNHKDFFGNIKNAVEFFRSQHGFYVPIVVEVHSIKELQEATGLDVKHVMLDNFSIGKIEEAVTYKTPGMTIEVSGGIKEENFEEYLIDGVDAISVGAITHSVDSVDVSFKYTKI